jgi:hypothetical protein
MVNRFCRCRTRFRDRLRIHLAAGRGGLVDDIVVGDLVRPFCLLKVGQLRIARRSSDCKKDAVSREVRDARAIWLKDFYINLVKDVQVHKSKAYDFG